MLQRVERPRARLGGLDALAAGIDDPMRRLFVLHREAWLDGED